MKPQYQGVVEFYDRFKGKKGHEREGYGKRLTKNVRLEALFSFVGQGNRCGSVLDVGCGLGDLYKYAPNFGVKIDRYVGIDISESMVAEAKELWSPQKLNTTVSMKFLVGDVFSVPEKSSFDWVVANGVFEIRYLESDRENWAFLLRTIKVMLDRARVGVYFSLGKENMRKEGFFKQPHEALPDLKQLSSRVIIDDSFAPHTYGVVMLKGLSKFEKAWKKASWTGPSQPLPSRR